MLVKVGSSGSRIWSEPVEGAHMKRYRIAGKSVLTLAAALTMLSLVALLVVATLSGDTWDRNLTWTYVALGVYVAFSLFWSGLHFWLGGLPAARAAIVFGVVTACGIGCLIAFLIRHGT